MITIWSLVEDLFHTIFVDRLLWSTLRSECSQALNKKITNSSIHNWWCVSHTSVVKKSKSEVGQIHVLTRLLSSKRLSISSTKYSLQCTDYLLVYVMDRWSDSFFFGATWNVNYHPHGFMYSTFSTGSSNALERWDMQATHQSGCHFSFLISTKWANAASAGQSRGGEVSNAYTFLVTTFTFSTFRWSSSLPTLSLKHNPLASRERLIPVFFPTFWNKRHACMHRKTHFPQKPHPCKETGSNWRI